MTAEVIVTRLRRFLLGVVAFTCAGTILELLFEEHFGESLQLIPFVLCAIALVAVGAVWLRPSRNTIMTLRIVMVIVAAGSLLGMFLHLANNFGFELEMRPNASAGDVVIDALMGVNPLLAPGILALAAVLAIASTYHHPALER